MRIGRLEIRWLSPGDVMRVDKKPRYPLGTEHEIISGQDSHGRPLITRFIYGRANTVKESDDG